jgi:hypothetical protein
MNAWTLGVCLEDLVIAALQRGKLGFLRAFKNPTQARQADTIQQDPQIPTLNFTKGSPHTNSVL